MEPIQYNHSQPNTIANILDELLAEVSNTCAKEFIDKLRTLSLNYYHDYTLLVIDWESLSTHPDIVFRPYARNGKPLPSPNIRYTKNKNKLMIYIQIYASKKDIDEYKHKQIPKSIHTDPMLYIPTVATAWLSSLELINEPVDLSNINVLSILTRSLIQANCHIADAIKIVILLHDVDCKDSIVAEMEEQSITLKATRIVSEMDITEDSSNFLKYVNKHRHICIYSNMCALKVIEQPMGCGFVDIVPRVYVIEPFIAIVTDTISKPLIELTAEERMVLKSNKDMGTRIRNYYVLRKNTREKIEKDRVGEYMSHGCYATKLRIFDNRDDADVVIGLLYTSMGLGNKSRSQSRADMGM